MKKYGAAHDVNPSSSSDAPAIVPTSNKSGAARPVVGSGEHVYEVIYDWGELPPEIQYGNTHGVCEDSQGCVYVHHMVNKDRQSHNAMVVFDAEGKFIASWGPSSWVARTVSTSTRNVAKSFSIFATKIARSWSSPRSRANRFGVSAIPISPMPINPARTGRSASIAQPISPSPRMATFGGLGNEPGKVSCPPGLIVDIRGDKEPILIVADRGNNRIQRFTLAGKHIDFVGGTTMPCHFAHSKNGDMVAPDLAARVTLMDRDNNVIEHLGDDSGSEWRKTRTMTRDEFTPGKFIAPHGACFDHAGNIFVVEWIEVGRVTKLRKV